MARSTVRPSTTQRGSGRFVCPCEAFPFAARVIVRHVFQSQILPSSSPDGPMRRPVNHPSIEYSVRCSRFRQSQIYPYSNMKSASLLLAPFAVQLVTGEALVGDFVPLFDSNGMS